MHSADQSYIAIKLDMSALQDLHLETVTAESVKNAILYNTHGGPRAPVIRMLKEKHVMVWGSKNNRLRIYPPEVKETKTGLAARQRIYFVIQNLKTALPGVNIMGIQSVSRAVINEEGSAKVAGEKSYYLLVEGYGLQDVMGQSGG